MTEQEWLQCSDPTPMLEFLRGKASDRQLRLVGCACCRRVWHLLPNRRSRKALEASERFADGLITAEKLQFVRGDVRWAAKVASRKSDDTEGVKWMIAHLTEPETHQVLFSLWDAADLGGRERQLPLQCEFLRDIIGNPFQPVTMSPAWLTPSVLALAQASYDERQLPTGLLDNARLAILADALEDAGCDNADILNHCRQASEHVRGCWLIDLLTGRT